MLPVRNKTRNNERRAVGQVVQAETVPPTVEENPLRAALERAFAMTSEDAEAVAGIVAECFEGQVEVNDETIDAEVRSLFYTLESKKLVSFRREEYDTAEGQKRRAFWWRVRTDVIAQLAAPEPEVLHEDVYAQLPAECWQRAAATGTAAEA